MRHPLDAWRRHLRLWAIPLGFCVLNLLAFGLYRVAFAGQVERLEELNRAAEERLEDYRQEVALVEAFLADAEAQQEDTRLLYRQHFQTEEERFTRVIPEIKRLARQSGLEPTAFSYPVKDFDDLVQRSIKFSVNGTYEELRTFINLLELTEHFVVLNSVSLGESGDNPSNPRLSITLSLSTIFAKRGVEVAALEPAS